MSTFATTLRYLRKKHGLSQQTVADGSGFDKSYISRLESDDRKPTRESVFLIAESMDLSANETDALLIAAEFAPVQVGSLLQTPELAQLDELIALAPESANQAALRLLSVIQNRLKPNTKTGKNAYVARTG